MYNNKKAQNDILSYIKKEIKIEDVLQKLGGLNLTKNGSRYIGNCPTKHPSESGTCFQVIPQKNFCYCHNCKESGTTIDLVMNAKKLNFIDAVKWFISEYHLDQKYDTSNLKFKQKTEEEIAAEKALEFKSMLLEHIVEKGRELLFEDEGKEVLSYLINDRKFDEEKIKQTEIFYFPQVNEAKALLYEEFPEFTDEIKELKLIGTFGDRFRLAWPYRNKEGLITGLIYRSIKPKGEENIIVNGKVFPPQRYSSSPGTDKTDLFGLHLIEDTDTLLIVEGYPDAIYFPALGYKNIVAIGQGSLSEKHLDGLNKKGIKNVIISFDKDGVGPKNTESAIKLLLENSDITPFVLDPNLLDPHKDPDEFVRSNGIGEFKKLNDKVTKGIDWLLEKIFVKNDIVKPIEKQKAEDEIKEIVKLIKSPVDEMLVIRAFADNFKVTKEIAKRTLTLANRENLKKIKSNQSSAENLDGKFWNVILPKQGEPSAEIALTNYLDFISEEGFAKHFLDKDYIFIKVKNNVVEEKSLIQIKDHILSYIKNLNDPYKEMILEKMYEEVSRYFSESLIECIPNREINFKRDERQRAFIYYQNGFVTLEKGYDPVFKGYDKLSGKIWEDAILKRDFIQIKTKTNMSDFEKFLWNVSGGDEKRFLSKCSAIGYMLHDYKDQSNAKVVVLCDEAISLNGEALGRTGKSLTGKAIGYFKNSVRIDARNFAFGDRFTFQAVKLDTKVLEFNDADKNFNFEKLFSVITDDMLIEYKNKTPFSIKFDASPKIMISTNYTIKGSGSSYRDRMFEVEFSDYYSDTRKPEDEFGHLFFDGWNEDEWRRFDNFMLECVQLYLDEGLIKCDHKNLAERKLIDSTSPEFVEFADVNIEIEKEYILNELFVTFKKHIGFEGDFFEKCPVKQNTFTKWLPKYAEYRSVHYSKRSSNGKQLVKFTLLKEIKSEKPVKESEKPEVQSEKRKGPFSL